MAGEKAGSPSRRRQGRRTKGGAAVFSLEQCATTPSAAICDGSFSLSQHVAVEAAVTGEKGPLLLRACTATQHVAAEDAATGEEGTCSLMSCPTTTTKPMAVVEAATGEVATMKRKLAAGKREALDMFPAKETASAIPHWAGPLSKPAAAATGIRKLLERSALEPMPAELFSEDAELRKRVKETLLTFPECKALSANQLDEAIDRIVKESKPETASVAGPGMVRLQDDDIRIWLFLLKTPTVDDILGVDAGRVFLHNWITQRKTHLDEQCQVHYKENANLRPSIFVTRSS
jgi:hypothetical protein